MAKVSLRAYNREIEAMTDRGQLDEAIAHSQHILKTFPKHLETYRLLGKAYLEHKRYKDAVDIFSRVLAVEPNDFVANVGVSIVRDEENKLDDAIWHMERAFEVQSANPAIQGELQRLYGRREGVQPPRIRMTRGALAHMYVQGELYPQAISEVKSVLKDDAGRSDMQVLMARAYFKSGQKTEAADAASAVLRRYPYCLDANRILVEIFGADRPENSQLYRQRVIELDPYAAQVSGSIFESNEVGDNAVMLEHFEWNGQPVGMQSDWESTQAIRLESENKPGPQAQPDWLKSGGFTDSTPAPQQPAPKVVPPLPASTPTLDIPTMPPAVERPTPEADIPDFLRAAGWGDSTGTFDESKFSYDAEPVASAPVSDALPIAQGDMPDWLKAMAPPPEAIQPTSQSFDQAEDKPAEDEVMPDWINNIGKIALPASGASSSSQPDWLTGMDQPATSQPFDRAQDKPASDDQPDWMKGFDQPASQESVSSDQPDWMKGFGNEPESTTASSSMEQPDWMTQFGSQAAESVSPVPASTGNEFDFLNEFTTPTSQPSSSVPAAMDTGNLGASQTEIDDSLAWMENLAAKQGATEGLLIKPEDRMEKEPDWVSQAKNAPQVPESVNINDDTAAWLRSLDEEESKPAPVSANDETAMWLKTLDEPEPAAQTNDMPAWMQGIREEKAPVAESIVPTREAAESDWMNAIEEPLAAPAPDAENIPSWLKGMDEESKVSASMPQNDLPSWMRDETGEVVAEPTKIEPTRPTDWHPVKEKQPEPPVSQPIVQEQPKPIETPVKIAAPKPTEIKPATPPEPSIDPVTHKGTGTSAMPIDPILGSARSELSRSNIPGALDIYAKLIKKARFLDEVIFDLREALYRYPVEVSIWQSLGDAYMRANRLQDALDAYTKAEELLR